MKGAVAKRNLPIRYLYTFTFPAGGKKEFEILLDPQTLDLINKNPSSPPGWASLDFLACDGCPLAPGEKYCPIAVHIAELVKSFQDIPSTERVLITVETPERTISKVCAVQVGLYSLMGIYMAASGCPITGKLKPMVRFHLPFASIQETTYRGFSMYLAAQYYRSKKGLTPDWTMRDLPKLYREINDINVRLSHRIAKASNQDAALNALVSLDVFTHFFQQPLSEVMDSLESSFQPYLEPDATTKS